MIFIKRKDNELRNIYYLNRLTCKNYNQKEIKYGDFLNICLKSNETTTLKLNSTIINELKYEIKTEGISNVTNDANIILYFNNNLLKNLRDFGVSEFGEIKIIDENSYFELQNKGKFAMIISFKIN